MHRIFEVPEVVGGIAHFLSGEIPTERKDALHFGYTCKAISEIALSAVWISVGVEALFCLLPRAVQELADYGHNPILTTPRQLTYKEWTRFQWYTRHVTRLHVFDSSLTADGLVYCPTYSLTSRVLLSGEHSRLSLAFPRLQTLDLNLTLMYGDSLTCCLSWSRLPIRSLNITICHQDQSFDVGKSLMYSFTSHRTLSSFNVDWSGPSNLFLNEREMALGDVISTLTSLKTIHIRPISREDGQFAASAMLPFLEEFNIDFIHLPCSYSIGSSHLSSRFANLKALRIHHKMLKHDRSYLSFKSLIDAVSSTSVELFHFSCRGFVPVCDLLGYVVRRWSATLTIVHLDMDSQTGGWTGKTRDLKPLLLVLIKCPNIEELWIEFVDVLAIQDKHFDAMSLAWPKLRSLMIYDQTLRKPKKPLVTSKATRLSLLYLAQRCQQLRRLAIPLNFDGEAQVNVRKANVPSSLVEYYNCIWSSCTAADFRRGVLASALPSTEGVPHVPGAKREPHKNRMIRSNDTFRPEKPEKLMEVFPPLVPGGKRAPRKNGMNHQNDRLGSEKSEGPMQTFPADLASNISIPAKIKATAKLERLPFFVPEIGSSSTGRMLQSYGWVANSCYRDASSELWFRGFAQLPASQRELLLGMVDRTCAKSPLSLVLQHWQRRILYILVAAEENSQQKKSRDMEAPRVTTKTWTKFDRTYDAILLQGQDLIRRLVTKDWELIPDGVMGCSRAWVARLLQEGTSMEVRHLFGLSYTCHFQCSANAHHIIMERSRSIFEVRISKEDLRGVLRKRKMSISDLSTYLAHAMPRVALRDGGYGKSMNSTMLLHQQDAKCCSEPGCDGMVSVNAITTHWPMLLCITPEYDDLHGNETRCLTGELDLSISSDTTNTVSYRLVGRIFYHSYHFTTELLLHGQTWCYNDLSNGGRLTYVGDGAKITQFDLRTQCWLYARTSVESDIVRSVADIDVFFKSIDTVPCKLAGLNGSPAPI